MSMNFMMENLQKKLHDFIDEKSDGKELSDDEFNELLQEFSAQYNTIVDAKPLTEKTAKTALDWLELAENTRYKTKKIKALNKALEIEPDNIDALSIKASLSNDSMFTMLDNFTEIAEKARRQLEDGGFFKKDCIGNFWQILETRPYLRALSTCVNLNMIAGRLKRTVDLCNEILRLNDVDNMGIRYTLLHCYARLEDVKSAEKLIRRCDNEETFHFIMPQALLYYCVGDEEKAVAKLFEAQEHNKHLKKFFAHYETALSEKNDLYESYPISSPSEVAAFFDAYMALYPVVFFNWGKEQFKKKRLQKK